MALREIAATPAGRAGLALSLALAAPSDFGGVVLRGPITEFRGRVMAAAGPLIRIPLHADERGLLGGIDEMAALASGERVVRGGLLDRDGALLLPSAERAGSLTLAVLGRMLDGGLSGACGPITPKPVIALDEAEPDETALGEPLLSRLAFLVSTNAEAADVLVLPVPAGWRAVALPDAVAETLLTAALRFGLLNVRHGLQLASAAKALAAMSCRDEVTSEDAEAAAMMVFPGRASMPPDISEPQEEAPPPPDTNQSDGANNDTTEPRPEEDTLVEALATALVLDLAPLDDGPRAGRSGRAGGEVKGTRGRPGPLRAGLPGPGARLDVGATLTAALPFQRLRGRTDGPFRVRRSDIRVRPTIAKAATLTVFCVDASGSQAYARMAEAKGAVEALLAQSYVRRDQVALVAFRRTGADVLLAPTASLTRAKRALSALPGGGGTPVASGLEATFRLALRAEAEGRAPGVVVLTDGRANVRRSGEGGRAEAMAEAQSIARLIRAEGWPALLVDTGNRPGPAARGLADAMGARYAALPALGAGGVAAAADAMRPR
ncbi:MAG: VWA domain-containing protein [Pseudomonadota bacterium]